MIDSYQHYSDQIFTDISLGDTHLSSCEFQNCQFLRCSFVESSVSNCRLVDCSFSQCDLSLLQVPGSHFSAVRFEKSKLIGVDWTRADWSGIKLGKPLAFVECALNHSTFIGLKLAKTQIKDCVAVDVDFREAELTGADFSGSDLAQSLFGNTDLSKADFSSARNYQIAPHQNTLTGAKFALPEAMSLLFNMDIDLVEV